MYERGPVSLLPFSLSVVTKLRQIVAGARNLKLSEIGSLAVRWQSSPFLSEAMQFSYYVVREGSGLDWKESSGPKSSTINLASRD